MFTLARFAQLAVVLLFATNYDPARALSFGQRKFLQEMELAEISVPEEVVADTPEALTETAVDELDNTAAEASESESLLSPDATAELGNELEDTLHLNLADQVFDEDDDEFDLLDDEADKGGMFDHLTNPAEGFISAFIRSFLVIVVIEVGDRTFFIAALLGIKHNQIIVFLGAFSALAFMTVVSTVLGVAAPMLLPRWFTHYAAFALFSFFGCQLMHKAYYMKHGVSEELEEVEEELDSKKGPGHQANEPLWKKFINPIFLQAFTMTCLAEWGDRSQIATIALAADYNPYGITVGGSLGHGVATAGAVIGGRYLATKISEKTITILGGMTFLTFAVLAFFEDPDEDMSKSIPEWMVDWTD